jgi:uncharacterized membrane protein
LKNKDGRGQKPRPSSVLALLSAALFGLLATKLIFFLLLTTSLARLLLSLLAGLPLLTPLLGILLAGGSDARVVGLLLWFGWHLLSPFV